MDNFFKRLISTYRFRRQRIRTITLGFQIRPTKDKIRLILSIEGSTGLESIMIKMEF